MWALAQEARLPIVFHVGGEEKLSPDYFNNGLPRVKDFHGGEENFTSLSFMPIPHSVQITWRRSSSTACSIAIRSLKFGAIELGASWVPSWMRFMDSAAANAFIKNEPRLQKLSLKPSEFVQRQVRVTPYPHEDVGWIIANSGEECVPVLLRLSARRRRPQSVEAFQRLAGCSTPARQVDRFYCDNFRRSDGRRIAARICATAGLSAA